MLSALVNTSSLTLDKRQSALRAHTHKSSLTLPFHCQTTFVPLSSIKYGHIWPISNHSTVTGHRSQTMWPWSNSVHCHMSQRRWSDMTTDAGATNQATPEISRNFGGRWSKSGSLQVLVFDQSVTGHAPGRDGAVYQKRLIFSSLLGLISTAHSIHWLVLEMYILFLKLKNERDSSTELGR